MNKYRYNLTGQLNEKGDVYSFGIVLLELITGKLPILKKDMNLGQWVKMMVQRGDIVSILDPRLRKDLTEVDANYITVWKTVELAVKCVEMNITERPRMSQIVVQLKECLNLLNARTSGSAPISMEIMSPTDSANTMSPTPR
ncbi:LRR receptor-like serine/threonine-protein kinase IOS1 [Amaranthus tricolor]|uniref:LRR receptor-like serine/threonine-protein kinase IOS1 n=1 Tax=Amaranthus tricolor TaxID=29722 RepID=UPI00258D8B90|nr:LRR receptor-like serine/threonine-protein kinase IOS1 [Amaranthus tricolor]